MTVPTQSRQLYYLFRPIIRIRMVIDIGRNGLFQQQLTLKMEMNLLIHYMQKVIR